MDIGGDFAVSAITLVSISRRTSVKNRYEGSPYDEL